MHVLAIGDAWEGMDLHGPFASHEDAVQHAMVHHKGESWAVVEVFPVETTGEGPDQGSMYELVREQGER